MKYLWFLAPIQFPTHGPTNDKLDKLSKRLAKFEYNHSDGQVAPHNDRTRCSVSILQVFAPDMLNRKQMARSQFRLAPKVRWLFENVDPLWVEWAPDRLAMIEENSTKGRRTKQERETS